MSKIYPSTALVDTIRKLVPDAAVRCLWEVKGPKDTGIAWMACYAIGKSLCIVQTFTEGGWTAYTPNAENDVAATVADVLNRCQVPLPAAPQPRAGASARQFAESVAS
jgi:hypothetical protein